MRRKRIEIAATESRGPGRPRDQAARVAILQAGVDLTREVGYDALAMEAVAARAGVGKATVYRYWPNKEALMADAVEAIVRSATPVDTGTVEGDLLILMRSTMRMYQDPATPGLLPGLIVAMARSPLIAERIRNGFIGVRRAAMRAALERGIRRGELEADTDIELALDLLAGPMLWRSLMSGRAINEAYTCEIVRRVLRAFTPLRPAVGRGGRERVRS